MVMAVCATTATLGACHGLTDVPNPSTMLDPGIVQTVDGALGLYRGASMEFATVYAGAPPSTDFAQRGTSFALTSGIGSDEYVTSTFDSIIQYYLTRQVEPNAPTAITQPYNDMHKTRLDLDQAIGALRTYGGTTPSSLLAQLYAYRGYLYVMFGELYCSGVPFSRVIYGGDLALGVPETTAEMFEHAVAQFDTAIALAADSVRVQRLAYVGKARAQLNLGLFADASTTASEANVPTDFTYPLTYSLQTMPNYMFASTFTGGFVRSPGSLFTAERAGSNGLPYRSAGDPDNANGPDPRVQWTPVTYTPIPVIIPPTTYPLPAKFPDGGTSIVLASGIEARLIQAEAALHDHEVTEWETILNQLRSANSPVIPALTSDSTSGASTTLQENVMFRERAFWLFGTGHRFGDLRRLVRQYGRSPGATFPTGPVVAFTNQIGFVYSNTMNFAPPVTEQQNNVNFQGCLNRDA
jgi:hypothetical protein